MKIHGTGMMPHLDRFQAAGGRGPVQSADTAHASGDVQVTGGARFVSEIRAAAATLTEVRAEEVARARHDISSGQLLTGAEIEAAVDSLLAGL